MTYMRNTNVVPNDVANQTTTETAPVQAQTTVHKPLSEHVFTSVSTFLNNPANADTTDLYEIVMNEVERPLLNRVMQYTHGYGDQSFNPTSHVKKARPLFLM